MNKVIRFLELMWLVIAIVSFVLGVYHILFTTKEDAFFFFLLTILAVFLYFIRRRQRRKMGQ
ncbi:MAG TPA: hypothetical protein VKZ45_02280 [Vicingaceae bacterium]|nr:hypothetical protein [Vicingaceae bacterium]